ncbi:UDP-N-acetylmuramoyl-L-alanyl-D-glutamate--2,6-diaminopimelate ligase [Croceimicrobium hydrocarbonivorans]|uniref:UDP-N-acetylmuramoyl-L-alanyl-D-glutamate--2,6-diaminopimelate ligase n=1 Tax=Croceimicrobium hydrocarbonivorans TaxID=2761580 RepID=A0A7H0VI21_9FLAO|nr:UDP-N-acetylmuramoyl-L-alanyl-D-glutamate--2,6-diaminopimelate ligase [Croceimicrobium hydrocarbonivorans]QNR25369.1 UDP-N-acetylmuramoyl-L-alanyl-D-glutamate--2,6-diaminopimelate ligase [Croceimicrobium hydrocarbonivorans]
MKLLKDLLYGVPLTERSGSTQVAVSKVCFDSREVSKGALFVAVRGTQVDGHQFIEKALELGAAAIVAEEIPEEPKENVCFIGVKDSSLALALIAANFYDQPSEKLQLVGVTGTNGKTTTATLLYNLFSLLGSKSGLLSTVKVCVGKEEFPATHTTPDPVQINRYLDQMVKAGCKYCFMEASSHGIVQNRTAGLHFAGAVFTNISHDHLDYHGNFENYIKAKKKLFDDLPKQAFMLTNADDRHGETMTLHTKAKVYRYALKNDADYKGRILEHQLNGMLLRLGQQEVWTKLIGDFNAYNLLAIYSVALCLEKDPLQVATAISSLKSVAGRFQYLQKQELTTIVDYAHTPDALENVLKTIASIRSNNEKVITVVGCGGNRDAAKRPLMARIASEMSDQVILTSDNPRFEDPEAIIKEMEKGIEMHLSHKVLKITDRKQAIRTAIQLGQSKDLILIAGKGHETYQEIKGERFPFDDLAIARETLDQKYPD